MFDKNFRHIDDLMNYGELDGKFPPNDPAQPQGVTAIGRWQGNTVLAFWDRTIDKRFASNAAFVEPGEHTEAEMHEIAAREFPTLVGRMVPYAKEFVDGHENNAATVIDLLAATSTKRTVVHEVP